MTLSLLSFFKILLSSFVFIHPKEERCRARERECYAIDNFTFNLTFTRTYSHIIITHTTTECIFNSLYYALIVVDGVGLRAVCFVHFYLSSFVHFYFPYFFLMVFRRLFGLLSFISVIPSENGSLIFLYCKQMAL